MPILEEVQAFDILLCQSKYNELKQEYDRQMHLISDEARKVFEDVGIEINILQTNIESTLQAGYNPHGSVENLKTIKSQKKKLDGLNSLLKFKEILSKLDKRFTNIQRRLDDPSRKERNINAGVSLDSAKKIVEELESWAFWTREFCFLNSFGSIFGIKSLKRAKKNLQEGHTDLLILRDSSVPPNALDVERHFSTAQYYLQNVEEKLACEEKIITNSQSEMKRVKDSCKKIQDQVKKEKQLEEQYNIYKREYRAQKEKLFSRRHITLTILLCIAICVGLQCRFYASKVVERTDLVTVAPCPVGHNVSVHVALVNSEVYKENDLVLLLKDKGGVSSSSVQHVEGVTLLKDSLNIMHAGVYEVYYSIHIKPEHQSCHDFDYKPFQSYVLRTNPQDHSLESKLLWSSHSCCQCLVEEETKYSSGVFELNDGDRIQVIWQSKGRPIYFHEQSSFLGLSMLYKKGGKKGL